MIYAVFDNELPEPTFDFEPEHYGVPRGWWKIEDGWYLTAGAAKRELHSKRKFDMIVATGRVRTNTLVNEYNNKPFTVYRAEDLGIDRDPQLENERERV
jgi:hypothetical protein